MAAALALAGLGAAPPDSGLAVIKNFDYRQLNNLWRLQGMWQHPRGRSNWGVMVRKGFTVES